ncbi:MAG: hypothetical protein HYY93_14510 [Planctomycetes bacterium]|nr:hypothetical protein [Planctomycetota bacterium]
MAETGDVLFGKIAIQMGVVTQAQMDECISAQAATDPPKPLGEILYQKGYVTFEQLTQILETQRRNLAELEPNTRLKKEDVLFGRVVVREGLSTPAEVNECLRAQAALEQQGTTLQLGEIMVRGGYLSAAQVRRILERQKKRIMACPQCGASFNVVTYDTEKKYTCPKCQVSLVEQADANVVRVERTTVHSDSQVLSRAGLTGPLATARPTPRPAPPAPPPAEPELPPWVPGPVSKKPTPRPAPPAAPAAKAPAADEELPLWSEPPPKPTSSRPPAGGPVSRPAPAPSGSAPLQRMDPNKTVILTGPLAPGQPPKPSAPGGPSPRKTQIMPSPVAVKTGDTRVLPPVRRAPEGATPVPGGRRGIDAKCPICDTEFHLGIVPDSGRVKCPKCHTSFTA